ncbi:LD-carboxypeptidase [Brevibacterium sp. XM4083]|uniref:S66 peptidase family protein n=1 Tax=Brevibacterium sp. XM4083 TaxID=2583238 RepID=UPI00112DA32A|nr:LD-carboxypeptidase [Brevibacterium sp. XM4083]MCM1011405.1 LD-carboxypeptidase [Brevibacterium sp. XM4083]
MTSPYLDSAPLVPGDTVRLIAPSGPADEDSLQRAISQLEAWGLNVVPGAHLRARHPRVNYLAGTDEQRRADLVDAWCDPTAAAVIALRGGYGAMRLLDDLDFGHLARYGLRPDGRPKLLTGSSDITALHQAWDHHLGVATLFCPMPGNDPFRESAVVPAEVASWLFTPWGGRELGFPPDATGSPHAQPPIPDAPGEATHAHPSAPGTPSPSESRTQSVDAGRENRHSASGESPPDASTARIGAADDDSRTKQSENSAHSRTISSWGVRHSLSQPQRDGTSADTTPVSRARTLVPGTAVGRLVGGNLSLVAAGLGSPELADVRTRRATRGPAIAMLEDVDEELYRLDNLLVQLVRGGWFASADALVLGSWIDCAPIDEIEALVLDFLGEAGIPIVSEMGFGHDPDAPSTPLGVDVRLEATVGQRPRMWVER